MRQRRGRGISCFLLLHPIRIDFIVTPDTKGPPGRRVVPDSLFLLTNHVVNFLTHPLLCAASVYYLCSPRIANFGRGEIELIGVPCSKSKRRKGNDKSARRDPHREICEVLCVEVDAELDDEIFHSLYGLVRLLGKPGMVPRGTRFFRTRIYVWENWLCRWINWLGDVYVSDTHR